jgi:hypothetical protein
VNTTNVFETDSIRRTGDRLVKLIWNLGEIISDDRPFMATAQLSVSHNKDRKAFTASVSRVDVATESGFHVERFMIVGGTRLRLTDIPCARYSAKALEAAAVSALAELLARAGDASAVADPNSPA